MKLMEREKISHSFMCLAEVLEWLENNYTLTRKKFNDIVEKLKTAKAEKIR